MKRWTVSANGLAAIIAVAVLTVFLFLTLKRNEVWRSERTLWEDTVSKSPEKPGGHINLGREHARNGNTKAAIQEFQLAAQYALESYKRTGSGRDRELLALAQSDTGAILLHSPNPQERADGVKALEATFSLMPHFAPAAMVLGEYHNSQRNFFKTIEVISDSLNSEIGPGFTQVGKMYYLRASALCEIGALPQSNQDFQSASRIDADIPLTVCQKGE